MRFQQHRHRQPKPLCAGTSDYVHAPRPMHYDGHRRRYGRLRPTFKCSLCHRTLWFL